MKKDITTIAKGKHFTAVNIGPWETIKDFFLPRPQGDLRGKVFLKDSLNSTGTELSFQSLPPGTELPFFHKHRENEEIYVILRGSGKFQVDDEIFPFSEGSLIRVSAAGMRSLVSSPDEGLIYMVIQAQENSLAHWTGDDGDIQPHASLLS